MIRLYLSCLIIAASLGLRANAEENKGIDKKSESVVELAAKAEAKTQAKEWSEAAALWERVVEKNPVSGVYWGKLAQARREAKDYRKAIVALEKALETRTGYPWADVYDIACCHALLGEKDEALKWLEKSIAMGLRDLKHAREDEDLESIRSDPKYRELVAIVDVDKMSRTDGWRYDLKLLVRELKRLHYDLSKRPAPAGFEELVRKLDDEIPKLTDHQIEVGLMKLMRMAGDGHTTISPQYYRPNSGKSLPVQFYVFEEGVYVIASTPEKRELLGKKVLRIGDHDTADVLKALDVIISQDNKIWTKYVAPTMIRQPQLLNGLGLIPAGDKVTLTLADPEGKQNDVSLSADANSPDDKWVNVRNKMEGPDPLYLKNRKANYWLEYLADSRTIYFQYNAVQNDPKESLVKFCGRLFETIDKNPVDQLVIDLRWNSGGNNFLNRPLIHGLIRNDKVNQDGKLFVIVGRNTFSAAQCCATEIERHTRATFVGEPTGSAPNFIGESIPVSLPYSKMQGTISDLYWQNSVAMDYRTWIAPKIYTPPTFAAYSAKRDLALEAILALHTKKAD